MKSANTTRKKEKAKNMVLNEEFCEITEKETLIGLQHFLEAVFNCDVNYKELTEDVIKITELKEEINNPEKFEKLIKNTYKRYEEKQKRTQKHFPPMIKECVENGESKKRFTFMQTRNADYMIEINLLKKSSE